MNAIVGPRSNQCPNSMSNCYSCSCVSFFRRCENDIRRYKSWAYTTNWCKSNWNAYLNRRWHNTCMAMTTWKCTQ